MIQRLIKRLKGSAGYTLTEMTAVVATAGVLTAVMLPVAISQIQQGRVTAAAGDIAAIGSAVSGILRDTQDYPMRSGSSQDVAERFAKTLLLSTNEAGDSAVPGGTSAILDETATDTFTPHFYENTLYTGVGDVAWKGPYLSTKKLDSWGQSYLIFLAPVAKAAGVSGATDGNVMVLSAGPDRLLDTGPTATSPSNDDLMQLLAGGTLE